MQMYPAYKASDVLKEYAITFFTLLNEGYRLRYARYLMLANIASSPHLKRSDRTKFMDDLSRASRGFDDILNPSEGSSPEQLKQLFGK